MKRMFSVVALLSALWCFCCPAQAQVDTTTTQKLLQYIMQPLDKSQIPTGYLEEYGCPMLPMATFNGQLTDSNSIDMNLWRTLYFQLQTGWAQSSANPLPAITTINNTITQNSGGNSPIPIPILVGQYNTVKSTAFSGNLLAYNNGTRQVQDVAGRAQSPYQLNALFAACPNVNETMTGTDSFVIKSGLVWNNTALSITQVQVDFADGQGFQTVGFDVPFEVSYADTGLMRWTIQVQLSNYTTLQCYADYYVWEVVQPVLARYTRPQSVVPIPWGTIDPVAGVHSGATIWVNYSVKDYTGELRKPLIVVEGFDASKVSPNLKRNYSVEKFIQSLDDANIPSWDFNSQLDNIAGYDLVFIDFADGADDIVRNAAIVQEVINRVNQNKVNDNRFGNVRQQNVVLGLGNGGLCARYALANMTKNFSATPTETRLLITHDSPHKGANVPLGLAAPYSYDG